MAIGRTNAQAGGSTPLAFPDITYSGKYEKYFEVYGTTTYAEYMFLTSGTITVAAPTVVDFWLIGGGAWVGNRDGGGSGYTAQSLNYTINSTHAVTVGGVEAASVAGGVTASPGDGMNGGSGGGRGIDYMMTSLPYSGGTGAGFIMAKFRDATKNTGYSPKGLASSTNAGNGGENGGNGSPATSTPGAGIKYGGYGGGWMGYGDGDANEASAYAHTASQGVVIMRVALT